MPKNGQHNQVERAVGGSFTFTISILLGLLVMIIGVVLTTFLENATRYIFGVPLVIIGLLIPIVAHFLLAEKRD